MDSSRSLVLLLALMAAACGPAPGGGPLEADPGFRPLAPSQILPPSGPCATTATLVADLAPGPLGSKPRELVHALGALFFTAEEDVHGRELWRSSGAGVVLVKDVRPGSATSNPRRLTPVGDRLFFTAEDGMHGRELWVTDGTSEGTFMVKDIRPGSLGSDPEHLLAFGSLVFFAADDGVNGTELWRSDGTPEGTFLVEDLYPGEDVSLPGQPGSSWPRRLTRAGDALYFAAQAGDTLHVWRSQGVPGATPVFSAPAYTFLYSFTAVGPRLFFLVDSEASHSILWHTAGGLAEPMRSFLGYYPHDLVPLGDRLFFSAGGGEPGEPLGEELWVSDGTAAGTVLVKDLWPGPGGSAPGALTVRHGRLYFAANGGQGRELWVSDGSTKGTRRLGALGPGSGDSAPRDLAGVGRMIFFSAETAGQGREPWMSDGSAAGTLPLTEIHPGAGSSDPRYFTRAGGRVFFSASDGAHGEELWALPFDPEVQCPDYPTE